MRMVLRVMCINFVMPGSALCRVHNRVPDG